MTISKLVLAAALTLASGSAFAGQQDRVSAAMKRGTVQEVSMERGFGDQRRAVTGAPASAPTIFGHAPLNLRYERPLNSNN